VLVAPYVSVTQSAVVQLAYGFGKPIIATDVGDFAAIIQHERTGLIVPPGDAPSLAAALKRFFEQNLAEQMQNEVFAVREQFSWRRINEVIDEVVLKSNGSGVRQTSLVGNR
jgi:glycosyltransferase involved in cell wall biosynthesis